MLPEARAAVLVCAVTWIMAGTVRAGEAQGFRLSARFEPVPVAVAGTLKPWLLTLDGRVLASSEETYESVDVGGAMVRGQPSEHRPFFAQTTEDLITVFPRRASGEAGAALRMKPPRLDAIEIKGSRAFLKTEGAVALMIWDGTSLPAAEIPAQATEAPGITAHVLELRAGQGRGSRLYNVTLERAGLEPAIDQYVAIGPMDSSEGGLGLGAGYGRKLSSRWRASAYMTYGRHDSTGGVAVYQHNLVGRLRGGYLPFDPGSAIFDARRWEVGLLVAYQLVHERVEDPLGPHSSNRDQVYGGIFQRWEPLRWRSLGAAIDLEFMKIHGPDHADTRLGLELSYHI